LQYLFFSRVLDVLCPFINLDHSDGGFRLSLLGSFSFLNSTSQTSSKVDADGSEGNFARGWWLQNRDQRVHLLVDVFAKDIVCCEGDARFFIPQLFSYSHAV
jgi:hypothetical protein